MTGRTRTKPWNTNMDDVEADERLYTDHEDEQMTKPCSMKFKTTTSRLPLWIQVHQDIYGSAEWDDLEHIATMRVSNPLGILVVKFHKTTNCVLVQGSQLHSWCDTQFGKLKRMVEQHDQQPEHRQTNTREYVDGEEDTDPAHSQSDSQSAHDSVRVDDDGSEDDYDDVQETPENHVEHENMQVLVNDTTTADTQMVSNNSDRSTSNLVGSINVENQTAGNVNDQLDSPATLLKTAQDSYITLCDRNNIVIEECKSEILSLRTDLNKIPNKILNSLKSYLNDHFDSRTELGRVKGELEAHKVRVKELVTEVTQQNNEIWGLKHELTTFKSPSSFHRTPQATPIQLSQQNSHPGVLTGLPPASVTPASVTSVTPTSVTSVTSALSQNAGGASYDQGPPPASNVVQMHHARLSNDRAITQGGGAIAAAVSASATPQQQQPATHGNLLQRNVDVADVRKIAGVLFDSTASDSDGLSSEDEPDADYEQARKQRRRNEIRHAAESLLIGDSTTKHVNIKRYMGSTQSFVQRASTSRSALDILQDWKPNTSAKLAVLHVGVNDIRDGVVVSDIVKILQACLHKMHQVFPNARIAYSEALFIGRENRESAQNKNIKAVNSQMKEFTQKEDYMFISHPLLQSPQCRLFDDDVHINSNGGTAVFVSDVYKATGSRSQRPQRSQRADANTDTDGEPDRVYYSRNYQQRHGRQSDVRAEQRKGNRPSNTYRNNQPKRNEGNVDMDNMIQMLTLNMLRKYQ